MGMGGPRCSSGRIGMKFTFVLALSFSTLFAASYAQGDDNDDMGRGRKRAPDVVRNIMSVIRTLADLLVPEPDMRENLHEHLETATTCVRKAEGLQLHFIRQFIAGIPRALDCVDMVFSARNKKQRHKAANCFVRKIIHFQKETRLPMDQVRKVVDAIECLKARFLT
ncbi:uncharacterized protein LOC142558148 [Dermacentor variabilis]|uniref:uncharacterized protein LOC142558148 n=1 Tax=Dermacentor variabilis TaxID=34621 RepID=UPI003F5C46A8